MFATAVRRFAGSALRCAETIAQMESGQAHRIAVAQAQKIAHNGFVDGMWTTDDRSGRPPSTDR